jgi:hypothetical protein
MRRGTAAFRVLNLGLTLLLVTGLFGLALAGCGGGCRNG